MTVGNRATKKQLRRAAAVGDTGIEPVTSSVSGKRATAAPIARNRKTGSMGFYGRESGRRDSNSRHPPWQGGALPAELRPRMKSSGRSRSNCMKQVSLLGGRYWDRTSDLFRVREARYRCANRPLHPEMNRKPWFSPRWVRDSNPCKRLCRPLPRLSANPPCKRRFRRTVAVTVSCERTTRFELATSTLARWCSTS